MSLQGLLGPQGLFPTLRGRSVSDSFRGYGWDQSLQSSQSQHVSGILARSHRGTRKPHRPATLPSGRFPSPAPGTAVPNPRERCRWEYMRNPSPCTCPLCRPGSWLGQSGRVQSDRSNRVTARNDYCGSVLTVSRWQGARANAQFTGSRALHTALTSAPVRPDCEAR